MDEKAVIVSASVELAVVVQSDNEPFSEADARRVVDAYIKQAFPVLKWEYEDTILVNYDEYEVRYSRQEAQ
jgi:hypothetical protein